MSILELEAQKAGLVREILCINDESMINNIQLLLKEYNSVASQQEKPKKRPLGILDGKASIVFKDDFEMTTEELLEFQ
jgi:hypothetical protein